MWIKQVSAIAAFVVGFAACATAPKTAGEQRDLEAKADVALQSMRTRDPGLQGLLDSSAGYVVFPEVGKGGFIVGGAHGRGILYEHGMRSGFVQLTQASVGAQIGAQTFSQLVVFQDAFTVQRLKAGTYTFGANASAVVLSAGAAANARFVNGVAVFTNPTGGVMAELSLSGQKLDFQGNAG